MEVELNLNIDTADVSSRFLNSIWAHNEIYHDCSTVCLTWLLSLIVPYASLFPNRQTMHKVIYIHKEILINNKWTMMIYEIQLNWSPQKLYSHCMQIIDFSKSSSRWFWRRQKRIRAAHSHSPSVRIQEVFGNYNMFLKHLIKIKQAATREICVQRA